MQVSDEAIRFSLPNVAAPFATVQRVSSAEGQVDRNRPHYHPDTIEICAVVRGQLDWFVAEETFAVRPGEVLVVPAEVVHGAVDSNLQPCELVTVHLAPEQLLPNLAEAARTLVARRIRHTEVSALVQRVFEVHRGPGSFLPEIVAALGTLLVASIVGLEEGDEERKKGRLIRQAQRAMMGGNAVRPTVEEVADRLGVSSVWLHRLFVRETGASPGDWARAKRLSDAKRMLEEGRLSTVAIAMSLGLRLRAVVRHRIPPGVGDDAFGLPRAPRDPGLGAVSHDLPRRHAGDLGGRSPHPSSDRRRSRFGSLDFARIDSGP